MVHFSVKTVLVDSGYSALLNDQILNTGDILNVENVNCK